MSARDGIDEHAGVEHAGVEHAGVEHASVEHASVEHAATGRDEAPGDDAPWWRSQADGMDAAEDPVALHLAARNGVAVGDAATEADAAAVQDPADGADAAAEAGAPVETSAAVGGAPNDVGAAPGDTDAHDGDAQDRREPHDPGHSSIPGDASTGAQAHPSDCEVCPICRGLAHVRATHPELAEHLVAAARHLTLAMREVVDTIGAAAADSQAGPPPPGESADRPERTEHAEPSEHAHQAACRDRPARSGRPARTGRARPGASPAARGFEAIPLDDVGGTDDIAEMENDA